MGVPPAPHMDSPHFWWKRPPCESHVPDSTLHGRRGTIEQQQGAHDLPPAGHTHQPWAELLAGKHPNSLSSNSSSTNHHLSVIFTHISIIIHNPRYIVILCRCPFGKNRLGRWLVYHRPHHESCCKKGLVSSPFIHQLSNGIYGWENLGSSEHFGNISLHIRTILGHVWTSWKQGKLTIVY